MAEVRTISKTHLMGRETTLGFNVQYKNLEQPQVSWVINSLEIIGLPTNNVTQVTYSPNEGPQDHRLGSVHMGTGELTLFKRLDTLPEIAQLGTLVHEMGHENDCFKLENARLFGGLDGMRKTASHVISVARQTRETGKFLNGYHRLLCEQLNAGKISEVRFFQETHSILIELRMTNPEHLLQVEEAQKSAMDRAGKLESFVELKEGVDKTLVNLIPGIYSTRELDRHVLNLRWSFNTKMPTPEKV